MKKKCLALALSICMVGGLAGCGERQLSNEYITITQYRGLEVPKVETTEVTVEMVESEIDSYLSAERTTEEITDRASQEGDTVNIDFTGSIDGVEFEGGSATGTSIEIGSGAMIGANGDYESFEDQLIGHTPGEQFVITVQFPDEYSSNPDLAGKVAEFVIKLNSISVVEIPELTDDWVKEHSEESETVDEYKKEIRQNLEDLYEETTLSSLKSEALQALADKTEVTEFPENAVEEQQQSIQENYESLATAYGMEFADFLEMYMGMTEEEFTTELQRVSEETVKQRLAVELLAEELNLEPSDEEYQEAFEQYAEDYGYESADAMVEQVGEDVLKELVRQDVVGEYLAESCVQVESTEE